ncbi:ATP-grasp domain-containing protein [Saccharothrix syringae]|uniref:ATP-grasp domain-containing protein n=1 Tax=Saccharothrix syringae TaxID=103733 RepID=A0A5Q0H582_SACSY|nr:ATP-grasp domain-containing protein [Saccharothrix syringae]QFZ20990.1 ATP-grasp domain-containing protein [Saccharothrix syringae]
MTAKPRLVVVCDRSAVLLPDLVSGLSGLGELVFLVNRSRFTEPLRPVLSRVGTLLDLPPSPSGALAAVRPLAPDGILTFSEGMIGVTAALAHELGLPYHSPDAARALTDKATQRALLHAGGADSVRSVLVTEPDQWADAVAVTGLPAVVKPARSQGSRNTRLVTDADAGRDFVRAALGGNAPEDALVVEEYLRGRDCRPFGDHVSVETVVSDGHPSHVAVTGKYPFVPGFREAGQFWPCQLDPDEQDAVRALAGRAVAALGVRTGLLHTEVKLTPAGPRLIEVNGRMGAWMNDLGRRAGGLDLVTIVGRLALGERVAVPPVESPRVRYQYSHNAPMRDCVLREVSGVREVRGLPTVVGYRALMHPGERVEGAVGTNQLDLLYGDAASYDEMFGVVERVQDALKFTFEDERGGRTVSAGSLAWETGRTSPDELTWVTGAT